MKTANIINGSVSLLVRYEGSGPLLLFVHGFPETGDTWLPIMERLRGSGRTLAAMDMRGYGESDKPEGVSSYDLDVLASDIAAVVKHFGDKASAVGHDWGGAVLWRSAHLYPELFEKIVAVNVAHPSDFLHIWKHFRQLRKSWYVAFFEVPGLFESIWKRFGLGIYTLAMKWNLKDAERAAAIAGRYYPRLRDTMRYPMLYYRAFVRRLFGRTGWRKISVPALVLMGKKDWYVSNKLLNPPARIVETAEAKFIGDSHWLQYEKEAELAAEIRRFLGLV